jgi:serine protease Do
MQSSLFALSALLAVTAGCSPGASEKPPAKEIDAALMQIGTDAHAEAPLVSSADANVEQTSGQSSDEARAAHGLPDFTDLVDRYGDAVVNVNVIGRAEGQDGPDGNGDEALRDFFRRFGVPVPEGGGAHGSAPLARGTGSGFIVSADGYILTNAHVVGDADEITVRLTDRREFPARLIGADTRTDVAVIKIDAKDLPVVSIGDPASLRTGEWVLAIGSPFGLDNTATAGIVSATARSVGGGSPVPFIQTDVAVNPGNSGGPLFNLDGKVVGINSMIFSQSGGYMGISFAVPIDEAMQVREQLVKTGKVVRGRIGVGVQDVDAALAKSFDLDRPRGALVSFVEPGSPAEQAGVKPGDVVVGVNGKDIDQSSQLSNTIASLKPGSDATLNVWRSGKGQDVRVKVAELKDPEQQASRGSGRPGKPLEEDTRLGLSVRPITAEEKQSVDTDGSVVVENVQGSAARAGLQPGDIILAINQQEVKSVQDLRRAADKLAKGDSAALLVERGGTRLYVPVRAG